MQGPYHLIPLAFTGLTGYLLTLLLVRAQVISGVLHRKIWNTILLVSFLVSGILGLLLVIRLNYKLEWPFLDPWMKWHVDAGILLSLAGAFHLAWHLRYYLSFFNKQPAVKLPLDKTHESLAAEEFPVTNAWIMGYGFLATVVQVLLLRSIVVVFQGNELMMGWTLGIWMFLTGAGSWLGQRNLSGRLSRKAYRFTLLLAWIPPLVLVFMTTGKNLVLPPGTLVNPFYFLGILFVLLSPVCLLTGILYAWLVRTRGTPGNQFIRVYGTEALGSLLGGAAVSFLLIQWFNVLQSLLVAALLVHLILLTVKWIRETFISLCLLSGLTVLTFFLPVDVQIKSLLFNQNVLLSRETPDGNLTLSKNGEEYSFFENGNLFFTTNDVVVNEEFIHYAMLQHSRPEKILLVSGGIAGMVDEILKYPSITHVDYVEPNPELVRMASPYHPLPEDPRVHLVTADARRHIRKTSNPYDIAVMAIPDPSSLQLNRFYTDEFASELKSKMAKDGVVIYGLSPTGNYLAPEKEKIGAALFHTLSGRFRHVIIVPGERDYYVASDRPVSARMGELSRIRGTDNVYVNPEYMDDPSLVARGNRIREQVSQVRVSNRDRHPLPVFYHSLHFLSRFSGKKYLVLVLPILLLLLPLLLMNPVSAGMYVTGFTASSVEILLIFWFQVVFGNLYSAIGIIFALFMGGLALGAFSEFRFRSGGRYYLIVQALLGLCMLGIPLLWRVTAPALPGFLLWLLFIAALMIPAFLTGLQYVNLTLLYHPDTVRSASFINAADLWGSALGILVVSTALVPLAGIDGSCLILAALNGLVVAGFLIRKQVVKRGNPG